MLNPFTAATFLTSAAALDRLPPPDRAEVAFAGRSNAGKSSALNAICGRRNLARVSKTPGRTQLLNFFELPEARLVDLPGYGFAQVPHRVRDGWGELIGGFIETRDTLRGLVLIMDARHPLTGFDRQMLAWATAQELPCHILLSKSDKLTPNVARQTLRAVEAEAPLLNARSSAQLFSAKTGAGVDEARAVLTDWLQK